MNKIQKQHQNKSTPISKEEFKAYQIFYCFESQMIPQFAYTI